MLRYVHRCHTIKCHHFYICSLILFTLVEINHCLDNVTFTSGKNHLLAAFGDIDGDHMTDILLIHQNRLSFRVVFQHDWDKDELSENIFPDSPASISDCNMTEPIETLIPGDFHGHTHLSVVIVTKSSAQRPYNVYLVEYEKSTAKDEKSKSKKLNCSGTKSPLFSVSTLPAMVDYNGDMICDLLTYEKDGAQVYLGTHSGLSTDAQSISFIKSDVRMSNKYSSFFVDVTGDDVADLVYTGDKEFYYYQSMPPSSQTPYRLKGEKGIPFPQDCEIGQSLFIDYKGSGILSHLVPANCQGEGKIFALNEESQKWSVIASNLTWQDKGKLCFASFTYNSLHLPLAIRAGDKTLNGYPHLLSTFRPCRESNDAKATRFMAILENFRGESMIRLYKLQSQLSEIETPSNVLIASWLDLGENGRLDILYTIQVGETLELQAVGNFERDDTNFLKVELVSGNCPKSKSCEQNKGWTGSKEKVEYGANLPGSTFQYELKDVNDKDKKFKASQMSSSSFFALQTPYIVFGLGKYVNYVDKISVTIPFNHDEDRDDRDGDLPRTGIHDQQIVPDAQILVIPYPPDKTSKWTFQLYLKVTYSNVYSGLYTLLGICGLLICIILILHRLEKLEDAPESAEFRQNWLDRR